MTGSEFCIAMSPGIRRARGLRSLGAHLTASCGDGPYSRELLWRADPCSVSSAYGEGKRLAESLCAAYSRDKALACAIGRGFTFLGPYMALALPYAIGSFLASALAGKPIRISGDGTALRSYLYASDLAVWLWTLLLKGPVMQAANVVSDQAISILALAEEVLAALDLDLPIEVAGTPVPGTAPARYAPSVQVSKGLGLRQAVSSRDAIRRDRAMASRDGGGWGPKATE